MNILVIGGTSFNGPHVLRGLLARGHGVTVFHRGEHRLPEDIRDVAEILGDARELSQFATALRAPAFDVVLHMVAMTRRDAEQAAEVFAGHAKHLVVASSQDVYAAFGALLRKEDRPPSSLPLSETAPLRTSRYIRGGEYEKIDVEEIVAAHAETLPATILRMPAVYGPGDAQHRFYPFLKRMEDKRPAILLDPAQGNFRWSHAYVENVAHALVLAVTSPLHEGLRFFNIGEGPQGRTPTVAERLHTLARAARYRGQVLIVPRDECPKHLLHDEVDFRHDVVINDAAIRRELGYSEIVTTEEAFRRTVAWERANPPGVVDARAFDDDAEDRVLEKFGLLKKK
ncbi:MAG: NAD-dependent epimerase/dehydratase family protein [Phycisphaerae bacterium]